MGEVMWQSSDSFYTKELRGFSIENEGGYLEEYIDTSRGQVMVALKGDRSKPAIVTYHDLGLNHVANFQVLVLQMTKVGSGLN